jgi:AcrR family transcriptional regulator
MTQQARAVETHSRIMDAAAECFAEQGYDAAGVAEICRLAGVSKGAFYHHFPSKQAVFLELLGRWLEGLKPHLALALNLADDVPQGMLAMAQAAGPVFEDARGQLPLYFEFWSRAARDPAVWDASVAPYHQYRDWFAEMIRSGVKAGSLDPIDATAAARTIVALAMGMILQSLLDPEETDWGRALTDAIQILLNGMIRRSN